MTSRTTNPDSNTTTFTDVTIEIAWKANHQTSHNEST